MDTQERKNWNQALIVDDNAPNQNLLRRIAQGAGYEVVTCSSFEEFKQAYASARPTVIIADLILGEEDCEPILDFLAKVHCKVPLILVTGHVAGFLDVMETRARAAGLSVVAKVEKRKSLFQIEDRLLELRIPEVA